MSRNNDLETMRSVLLEEIRNNAFISKQKEALVSPSGGTFDWFLDLKGIVLKPKVLDIVSGLFWDHLRHELPFQIGGLETISIALIAGISMKAEQHGSPINAFYVRKSRKIDGMQRMIEGTLTQEKVILIDDALNSGKSIVRQVEALKKENKRVVEVCTIVAFRDPSFYEYFRENGIRVWSIFTLDDFPESGGLLKPMLDGTATLSRKLFDVVWKFESKNPEYFRVLPKSAPVLDDERVYFGADNGSMWALNQTDGSVAWNHRVLFGPSRKRIFSSPALSRGILYFGAYDGNFYALDAKTGRKKWVDLEADWIGSSPCIAEDLGLVYVGLEFGLWKKQGGIVAFDATTGEKRWWQQIESYVHSSPSYSKKFNLVIVGSQSGEVYALNAKTGEHVWTYCTEGSVKASFAFDEERGLVAFGSWDDHIYILEAKTGALRHKIPSYKPIYSSPVVWHGRLYFGLLDKRVVCVDLDTGTMLWDFWTHSRVFATPEFINGELYIGSNDGRVYILDPDTGKEHGYFQTTERIVNKVAFNPKTGHVFVPTYANELYCLAATQPIATAYSTDSVVPSISSSFSK